MPFVFDLDPLYLATGCRHFGLLAGQQERLNSFGLVGLLAKYSPDVGTALRSLVRFFHLHNRGATIELAVAGDRTTFSYGAYEPLLEAGVQLGDGAVALILNLMRDLCGTGFAPIEARFAHRPPENTRPFSRFFRAPLQFDAEQSALVFSTDWLNHPLPDAGAELQRLLQQQIDTLEARHGDEFAEQVRSVLRTGLLTGHASAAQVAALFSIHARTLTRRLASFGTSFKALADEGRFEIARQMLENTSLDVNQIAVSLDYADAT